MEEETFVLDKRAIAVLKSEYEEFEISRTKKEDEIKISSSSFKAVLKEPKDIDLSIMQTNCNNLVSANISLAKKVMYATGINESKPILQGICFKFISKDSIEVAALDGYRIAKTIIKSKTLKDDLPVPEGEFVINKTNLSKIISLSSGEIGISVLENKVLFLFGRSVIAVKKMSGKFIDYNKMLNIQLSEETDIVKEDLINILNRFAVVSENRKVNLYIKRDSININSKDTTSLLEDSIMCESTKDLDISFNQRYLLEFLEYIDSEDIKILYNDTKSPIKVTDGTTTNLLLPVLS